MSVFPFPMCMAPPFIAQRGNVSEGLHTVQQRTAIKSLGYYHMYNELQYSDTIQKTAP